MGRVRHYLGFTIPLLAAIGVVVVVHAPVAAAAGGQGDPVVTSQMHPAAPSHNGLNQQTSSQIELVQSLFPDHLRYPDFIIPAVEPGPPSSSEMLTCELPCRVVHRIELDQTPRPRQWLNDLLTMVIGRAEPWSPTVNGRLHMLASGLGQTVVRFQTVDRCIIFNIPASVASIQNIQAQNDAHFVLSSDKDRLVVSGPTHQWVFSYQASSGRWCLQEMSHRQFPDQRVKLVYDGSGLLQTIELPNGERVQFGYRDGYVTEIQLPYGKRMVEISRDDRGYVTRVAGYRAEAGHDRSGCLFEYRYECDDSGRLTAFTNNLRQAFTITTKEAESEPASVGKNGTSSGPKVRCEIAVTRRLDNACWLWQWRTNAEGRFQRLARVASSSRQAVALEGNDGLVEFASTDDPPNDDQDQTKEFPHVVFSRVVASELQTFVGDVNISGYCFQKLMVKRSTGPPPAAAPQPAQRIMRDSLGRVIERRINEQETAQYHYGPKGDLQNIQIGERQYQFRWDSWGCLTEQAVPGGDIQRWLYNPWGGITAISLTTSGDREHAGGTRQLLTCEYTPNGDIQSVQWSDNSAVRLIYDPHGRLAQYRYADGTAVQYAYDMLGRLMRRTGRDNQLDTWTYQPGDLIASHTPGSTPGSNATRGQKITHEFNCWGQRIAETIPGVGRTTYAYDNHGRIGTVTHPDKTTTIYTYDGLDRIVEVHGTHQSPMRFSYDKQGQRQVENLPPSPQDAAAPTSGGGGEGNGRHPSPASNTGYSGPSSGTGGRR